MPRKPTGRPPGRPRNYIDGEIVSVWLPRNLKDWLDKQARARGWSRSKFLTRLVRMNRTASQGKLKEEND